MWHLPAFFYLDTYQSMPWIVLPGFIFGILCGAVLLTWVYNGSGGSVLLVAIWHALFDLVTASQAVSYAEPPGGTVHRVRKSIYSRIDAPSREEAVAGGSQLGLI